MKPQAITQEMLLLMDSSFAKRELCERNGCSYSAERSSTGEQLEKACWSGFLFEMFPELFEENDQKKMCVWRVNRAEQFIHVEAGSCANSTDHLASIDPYFFLPLVVYRN